MLQGILNDETVQQKEEAFLIQFRKFVDKEYSSSKQKD